MRTTLAIDDAVLAAARKRAGELGLTLGQLAERALQRELARRPEASALPPLPVSTQRGGPRPGVDLTSNRAVYELLDEGVPLDKLR